VSAHMSSMTTTLIQYAKAAQHLPMAWLTQAEFPARSLVKDSFREALEELPESDSYQDGLVRSALQSIVDGVDPRGGSFQAQAVYAAAQLHDRVAALVLEPRMKKAKVRKGSVIHGFAGGLFGETYWHREVTEKSGNSIRFVYLDGPHAGQAGSYRGDLKELVEYLVPDHHCPEDCTLGQN
jgi:hypothetical protein